MPPSVITAATQELLKELLAANEIERTSPDSRLAEHFYVHGLYAGAGFPAPDSLMVMLAAGRSILDYAPAPAGAPPVREDGKWRIVLEFDNGDDAKEAHTRLRSLGLRPCSITTGTGA